VSPCFRRRDPAEAARSLEHRSTSSSLRCDLDAADAQRFPLQLISDAARESNDQKYFSSHHYSVVSQTRMLTNKCYMPLSEFVFYAH
jgi:hypothetical protein